MGWEKYDPKNPPKMGQKARSRSCSEFAIEQGYGHGLCQGDERKPEENWEVYWERRPAIGSFIKVVDECIPVRAWAGSVGKVVSHDVDTNQANIDWVSGFLAGKKNDCWSFPNSNVEAIDSPNQVQVGDHYRNNNTGAVAKIIAVADGKCDAEIVFVGRSSYQPKEIRDYFGSSTIDHGWSEWKKLASPKVGEVYSTSVKYGSHHNSIVEITKIHSNGRVSVKIIETDQVWKVGSEVDYFFNVESNGFFPLHWRIEENYVKEEKPAPPQNPKLEVGQVWTDETGHQILITAIKPGNASAKILKTGDCWQEGDTYTYFASLDNEGRSSYFGKKGWEMMPSKAKVEVGQIYQLQSYTYRITKIEGKRFHGVVLDSAGKETGDVSNLLLNEDGSPLSSDVKLITNYRPQLAAVGQVYRNKTSGQVVRLSKIEGTSCQTAEVLETGDGMSPGKKGEIRANFGVLDSKGGTSTWQNWDYLPDYKAVEVGQVYRRACGWTFKITEVKDGRVSTETLESGKTVYEVGRICKGWISPKDVLKEYERVLDYQPKIQVGQVWRRSCGWTFKITDVKGGISAEVLEVGDTGFKVGGEAYFSEENFRQQYIGREHCQVVENYQPKIQKVQVGQVWKDDSFGWVVQITAIDGEFCDAKTLESGRSSCRVGENSSRWGRLKKDGTTNFTSGWELVKNYTPPKTKVQVGQVYSCDGWVVRITSVSKTSCGAETLASGSTGWVVGHKHSIWGSLKSDGTLVVSGWKLEENYTSPKPKFQVGEVWKNHGNWTFKITGFQSDRTATGITLEQGNSGYKAGHHHDYLIAEDATTGWERIENYIPAPDKVEVGQIWKDAGGCVAKITKIEGIVAIATILEKGEQTFEVGTTTAWKDVIDGRFRNPETWVRQDNYLEIKVEALNPKIKVGQIWTYYNGLQVQVVKITSSFADVRVLQQGGSGFSPGYVAENYVVLDKDGKPTAYLKGKQWTLTQDATQGTPKVGEVYSQADGWKVKITGIIEDYCSGTTIQNGNTGAQFKLGTEHKKLDYLDNGLMPKSWTLVEAAPQTPQEPTPEKPMEEIKVGQVWTNVGGATVRIVKIGDGIASLKVLKRGGSIWTDGQIVSNYIQLNKDGAAKGMFGMPGWSLTTQAPTTLNERARAKAGEVYRKGDDVVRVIENKEPYVDVEVIVGGTPGSRATFSTFGNGKMHIDWELIEEALNAEKKNDVKVGSIWRANDGWTVEITQVEGRTVWSKCVEGTSFHTAGTEYGPWTTWIDKDGLPDKTWHQVENYKGKEMGIQAKVGQVWTDGERTVRITGLNGPRASVEYVKEWSSYKVGFKHDSFFNQANTMEAYTSWKRLPMVGDRVDVQIDINGGVSKTVFGIYLGDVGGETDVVYLDEAVVLGRTASWAIGKDAAAAIRDVAGVKVSGKRCWSVVSGESKITKVFEKEGETVMGNEKKDTETFGSMVKTDFKEAMWRAGATQMTNAVQSAIMAMLKDKGFDGERLTVAKEILDSEFGAVLIRAALGFGLPHVPAIGDDPRAQKLAKEFRVSAMDRGAEEVMGAAMTYLMPALTSAMNALPPLESAVPAVLRGKPKSRVAPAADADLDEEEEAEEEKSATAG